MNFACKFVHNISHKIANEPDSKDRYMDPIQGIILAVYNIIMISYYDIV